MKKVSYFIRKFSPVKMFCSSRQHSWSCRQKLTATFACERAHSEVQESSKGQVIDCRGQIYWLLAHFDGAEEAIVQSDLHSFFYASLQFPRPHNHLAL